MDVTNLFIEPMREMLVSIGRFLPKLGGALVLLLVGLTIAKVLETVVVRALKVVQVDLLAEKVKISDFLIRGGITMTLTELLGAFAYWLVLLLTFITALNALSLTMAADLFSKVVHFLPNVVGGMFIFGVGLFFASFLSAAVRTAASNAGMSQANFLGQIVQIIVLVFTALLVLEQLKFHIVLIQQIVIIVMASLGLGVAIAIGLGTKDLMGELINDLVDRMRTGRKR